MKRLYGVTCNIRWYQKWVTSKGENCGLEWLHSKAGKIWRVSDKLARAIQSQLVAVLEIRNCLTWLKWKGKSFRCNCSGHRMNSSRDRVYIKEEKTYGKPRLRMTRRKPSENCMGVSNSNRWVRVIEHHILFAKRKVIVNVLWIAGSVKTEYTFLLVFRKGVLVKWWRWKMEMQEWMVRKWWGKGGSSDTECCHPHVSKNLHL